MSKLTRTQRLVFLDVLRLIAAVQMIQGHSVSAVLASDYQQGLGYMVWTFARGLTSVLFLTTAGLAFVLAEAGAATASARRRRCLRALRLVAIGYLMHAPLGAFFGVPLERALASAVAVDVLQCIGVSLLGLELLSASVHRRSARALLSALLALLCFAGAPALRELELSGAALLFGNYLTARYGSLFPLLPWAGYAFAGFSLGTLALHERRTIPRTLASAGLASLLIGLAGLGLAGELPLGVSPAYAAVKLGCVWLLAGVLAQVLAHVERLPRWASLLASETLFLYVSHVVLLYADGLGLATLLGDTHGPLFGLALALALMVVCSAGALGFRRLERSLRATEQGGTRGAQPP